MELNPLSITTVSDGLYDNSFTNDGFIIYRYRGTDPNHRDNVDLREAMKKAGSPDLLSRYSERQVSRCVACERKDASVIGNAVLWCKFTSSSPLIAKAAYHTLSRPNPEWRRGRK